MGNQGYKIDWNNINWDKYANGIWMVNKPIKGINLSSSYYSENLTVSYWDGEKWQKIEN